MKNLVEATKYEQVEFINSFDYVLSDMDGVIWLEYKPIPGALECVRSLKQLGKKVRFVTNNTTGSLEFVRDRLEAEGLKASVNDIAVPTLAIVSYLKKIKFNRELYVLGVKKLKEAIREAGFLVAEDGPLEIEETLPSIAENINDNKNVGGVLLDLDINMNFIKLQKAITYLKRKDCIFLGGPNDARIPLRGHIAIGPYYFTKPVIDITGREPHRIAKPHETYNEYIVERFKITNPQRILFVGDSVNEDMAFATNFGYHKLLVLSGVTSKDDINKWEYLEEYRPQFYVESLKDFDEVISNCLDILKKE